jgi:hypothetical protein
MEAWKTILLAFGGNAALLAVLGLFGKSLIEKILTRDSKRFELELKEKSDAAIERLRNELQLVIKQTEFNFSRKVVAFDVYFNKKHDSYITFYDLISKAHGMVVSLYGFRKDVPIESMKTDTIIERMQQAGIPASIIEEYKVKLIGDDVGGVLKDITKMIRWCEFNDAEKACYKAKNHLILSRLYFDEELFRISLDMCNNLLYLYNEYEMSLRLPGAGNSDNQKNYIQNINSGIDNVIEAMKTELSVGYFNQPSQLNQDSPDNF